MNALARLIPHPSMEAAYFLHRQPRLLHWRYLPFHALLLLAALWALIPFGLKITEGYTRLLGAITVVVYAARLGIILRTLVLSARVMAHETTSESWRTGLNARQIVRRAWWSVLRRVWGWHMLVGLLNLGLALGLAQHIFDTAQRWLCGSPFTFVCYPMPLTTPPAPIPDPSLSAIMVALVIVLGFGLLEAALVPALGILGALIAECRRVSPVFMVIIVYGLVAFWAISVAIYISHYTAWRLIEAQYAYVYSYNSNAWMYASMLGSGAAGVVTLADGGTLIAANTLRLYGATDFNHVRTLVRVAIGIGCYIGVILISLRLAQSIAVRSGAARPVRRPLRERFAWMVSPVARAQAQTLRELLHQNRWPRVILWGLFTLALIMAWMGRWVYPDCTRGPLLRVMAGAVYGFYAIVVLRTLVIATRCFRREHEEPDAWDVLLLTGVNSRQLILGKWWAALREVWGYHVMAAFLKLGLAYGVAQYLFDAPTEVPPTALERAFYYLKYNFGPYGCSTSYGYIYHNYVPISLWAVVRAGVVLGAFGLIEAALLCAIGLISALIIKKNSAFQLGLAVFLRFVPITLCVVFLQLSLHQREILEGRMGWFSPTPVNETHTWLRALDTVQTAASTVADGGLAVANLMRWGRSYYYVRQLLALGIGLVLYVVLTYMFLRGAQWIARRRGALPP